MDSQMNAMGMRLMEIGKFYDFSAQANSLDWHTDSPVDGEHKP